MFIYWTLCLLRQRWRCISWFNKKTNSSSYTIHSNLLQYDLKKFTINSRVTLEAMPNFCTFVEWLNWVTQSSDTIEWQQPWSCRTYIWCPVRPPLDRKMQSMRQGSLNKQRYSRRMNVCDTSQHLSALTSKSMYNSCLTIVRDISKQITLGYSMTTRGLHHNKARCLYTLSIKGSD